MKKMLGMSVLAVIFLMTSPAWGDPELDKVLSQPPPSQTETKTPGVKAVERAVKEIVVNSVTPGTKVENFPVTPNTSVSYSDKSGTQSAGVKVSNDAGDTSVKVSGFQSSNGNQGGTVEVQVPIDLDPTE